MGRANDQNYWSGLDSADFDFSTAFRKINSILSRPRFGRGTAIANWKESKSADKDWYPSTYWCYECNEGAFGRGIPSLNGPLCDWCRAPVEERCDMRRSIWYADGPKGSEFWTSEMWEDYDNWLMDYYDQITPDGD